MLLNQLLLDMWLNTAYTPHEIYSCRLFKYFHRSTTISYPSRKLEICGSPATKREKSSEMVTFFVLRLSKTLVNIGILRKNNSHNELDNFLRRLSIGTNMHSLILQNTTLHFIRALYCDLIFI